MKPFSLPQPWYFTPAELAVDWKVDPARVYYYMDAGQIIPAVALARCRWPYSLPCNTPVVVAMLDGFAHLQWSAAVDPETALTGELRCFQPDGAGGFRSFVQVLAEPLPIRRSDLVVSLDQRDEIEGCGRRQKTNPVERRTLLTIIGIMARCGYATDMSKPYALAEIVRKDGQLLGIDISHETLGQKLAEARDLLTANVEAAPQL